MSEGDVGADAGEEDERFDVVHDADHHDPLLSLRPALLSLNPPLLSRRPASLSLKPSLLSLRPAPLSIKPPLLSLRPALLSVAILAQRSLASAHSRIFVSSKD